MNRPKPLFLSTAQQLGIHRTRGIPSLLDSLLSPGTYSPCLFNLILDDFAANAAACGAMHVSLCRTLCVIVLLFNLPSSALFLTLTAACGCRGKSGIKALAEEAAFAASSHRNRPLNFQSLQAACR